MKLLLGISLQLLCIQLYGQIQFTEIFYPFSDVTQSISQNLAADFNQDGHMDYIFNSRWGERMYLALGTENGSPSLSTLSRDVFLNNVEIVDIDLDGDMDIIARAWVDEKTALWRNDGFANFEEEVYPIEEYQGLQVIDSNNDGTPELLTKVSTSLLLYRLTESGFNLTHTLINNFQDFVTAFTTLDVNQDGLLDIVVNIYEDGIVLLEQQENHSFERIDVAVANFASNINTFSGIKITADLTEENNLRVIRFNSYYQTTQVLEFDDQYNVMSTDLVPFEGDNTHTSFGDIDGDGDQDVLFYEEKSAFTNGFLHLFNNNNGTFERQILLGNYRSINATAIYDVDFDGDMDIVAYSSDIVGGGGLITLINETATNIEDVKLYNRIKLYPNPTKDMVFLDLPNSSNYTIEVYDGFGHVLLVQEDSQQVNLMGLPGGLYTLVVKLDGKKMEETARIVKID